MSKSRIPQPPDEVSSDDLEPAARQLLERAEEIAAAAQKKPPGRSRRWSEDGAVCAALAVEGVRRALLTPGVENHTYAHRLFRAFPCSDSCLARDLWAVLRWGIERTKPAKDWPVRPLLAALIEQETHYTIEDAVDFDHQVKRDLTNLEAALAAPRRRRTRAQKRLIASYNVVVDLRKGSKMAPIARAGDIAQK